MYTLYMVTFYNHFLSIAGITEAAQQQLKAIKTFPHINIWL